MDTYWQIAIKVIAVMGILTSYKYLYLVIGFFCKPKKYPNTDIRKKYAIIIAARNEEKVLGGLLDSINMQTYPKELITTFVVSDNSTDSTASLARSKGAICYERFNKKKQRKGWALEFLFENIDKDYGITSFDAYFFFDADNLLSIDYIEQMNKAFVYENGGVINSYRNTKNFETNFVSSAYGFHFYRSNMSYHRARHFFRLGTHIAGTGYMCESDILKNGWHYHNLTEDTEFTIDLASKNKKIRFCEEAVFYDEQPTNIKTTIRQRVRWTRGRLIVFLKFGYKLIFNMFRHLSFTSYDMFFYLFPWGIVNFLRQATEVFTPLIKDIFINQAFINDYRKVLFAFLVSIGGVYINNLLYALAVVFREKTQIHCSRKLAILYAFTYPWFNIINLVIAPIAIFKPRVKWKVIEHNDNRKITDIKK